VRDFEELAALLVGGDPRLAADRTLGLLLVRCEAAGGAVLKIRAGELHAFVQHDLSLDRLSQVRTLWQTHRHRVDHGRVVTGADFALVPLRDESAIVGVVFIDRPGPFDLADIEASLLTLTTTVISRDHIGPLAAYFTPIPGQELQREMLLASLDRNEWNISRVARVLGLARRTVYLRMRRYRIPRKRVTKAAS
jgi:ActR/RegA family two-component response regulator